MKIYYLGPKGSYSYLLAVQAYDKKDLVACDSFSQIHKSLLVDKDSLALVPLENSITSDVYENVDFLFENDINISAEFYLKISLNLISLKGASLADIKKAYSHPKALAQSSKFLTKHAIEPATAKSTSAAQEKLLKENSKNLSAVGSSYLKNPKKLTILQKNIGNDQKNFTRFVQVGRKAVVKSEEANKMTVIFTIPHKVGSLSDLLAKLSQLNANLTKIESRPIPGKDWEYLFWVDLVYNKHKRENILSVLQKKTREFRISGFYKKGDIYIS